MNWLKDLLTSIIGRIGVVREPVLAFALLATLILFLGGIYLADHENEALNPHGIVMMYTGIIMLFLSLGIYVWMMKNLPGSTSELALNEGAAALIEEHERKRQRLRGE